MMRLALQRGPARLMPRQRSSGALPGLLRLAVVLLFTCYQLSAVSATVFSCVGGTVYVVAHPDDDLLFQSPDLWTDVVSGACITTIFLTSGDSGVGLTYAKSRESGNEAANSYMANVDDSWTEFVATFGGQPVLVRTLVDAPQVQRVWFRLPDGNVDGTGYAPNGYQSLRALYFGSISSISSVDGGATFTLATLKTAISDILTARQAKNVRTLDHLSDYDAGDHSDHITTARITSALVGNTAPSANFAGYMGYPINNFAPTLVSGSAQFVAKSDAFFQYTPFDSGECQSYSACTSAGRGEAYWLARQYVVTSALAQQSYTGSAEAPVTIPNGTNIARIANATASSYAGPTQVPGRAIDGIISGYPGNSSAEWVSDGGIAGTTFSLAWNDTYSVTSIVLYDRPNINDWAKGGTITFADGKSVSFGALANDGSATLITLSQTVITNSLLVKFTSVSAATGSVGLAEIQVYGDLCSGCQDTGEAIKTATTISATAFSDLALLAQATASSESNGQSADRVNDGVISGYPANWTAEWSTKGQGAGAWLNLTWPQSIRLDSLVFYDRPNLGDWITGGTLAFDVGSTVTIPSLNNDGSATIVNLTNAVTTTSLLFTVTSAGPSSGSVGLAELAVFYSQDQVGGVPTGSNTTSNTTSGTTTTTTGAFADLALTASASASSGGSGQTADRANDGVISGYPSNWTAEWATEGEGTGAWLNLTWSSHYMADSLVFYDRPNPDDWITGGTVAFSDGTTVTIPSLNHDGSATVVNLTAAVNTTTLLFTVTSAGPSSSSVGLAELGVFYSQAQSSSGTTAVNTTLTSTSTTSSGTVGSSDAYSDLALKASASASSGGSGQTADRANDGVISGYPSNWTAEWATQGEGTGAWLNLTWSSHYMVDSLVFYDRPNPDDWITGGTVAFSDGTTVTIPSLNHDGSATVVNLTAAVNTTTLLFTVTSAGPSSSSVGLAELGVFYSQAQSSSATTAVKTTLTSTTTTSSGTVGSSDAYWDLALTASASASSGGSGQTADRANDGVISGYPSNWTAEWATQGEGTGAWLNLTWSSHYMVDSLVFYDRPNPDDWITGGTVAFSDGTTVTIPSLNDDGSATVVNLTTAVQSSSLLFTVTSVGPSTGSAGLAELGVFYSKSQTPDLVMNNTTYVQSNNTATTSNSTSAIISLTTDTSVDLALNATATASSGASGQEPDKANDGKVSGYKEDGSGIWQQEWATEDQTVGAWLTLTWPSNVEINEVVLYDRPNLADHVTAGTLTFSSGAVVSFGALANNGSATSVTLAQPIIASVLTMTVTGVSSSSSNIGLAEIMVYGAVPVNTSANSTGSANSTLTNSTVETSSALGAVNVNSTLANSTLTDPTLAGNASLTNSTLANSTLTNSTLSNSTTDNSTLVNSTLSNSTLGNSTLGNSTFSNSTFINSTFSDPTLANSTLANSTLANSTLSNSTTDNSTLVNSTLSNSTLGNSTLGNSTFSNSTFINSTFSDPTLANSTLANSTLANSTLSNSTTDNSTLVNSTLSNSTLGNSTLGNSTFSNSTFINSTFSDPTLANSTLANSTLANSTLSNSTTDNSTLVNSTLSNSTLGNSTLGNSTFSNSTFINSTFSDPTLANSTLDNSTLANSTLSNSTTDNSTLVNSTLSNSTLGNSTLGNSTSSNSTFINSTFSDPTLANSTLANSTLDNSTLANSTLGNLTSANSTLTNSTFDLNSTMGDSTLSNSTLTDNSSLTNSTSYNSTVTNSTLGNSTLDNTTLAGDASLANSTVYNSTLANSTLTNSTTGNATLSSPTLTNSTLVNSTLSNSTNESDSTSANLTIPDSTLSNSTLVNSTLTTNSSAGMNSTPANSTLANSTLANSTLSGNTSLVNSSSPNATIANSTLANSTSINSTLTNSTLANSATSATTTVPNSTLGTNSSTKASSSTTTKLASTTITSPTTITSAATSATSSATTSQTKTTSSPAYSPQPTGSLRSYATYNGTRVTAGTASSTNELSANACGLRCDRTQCTSFDWKALTKECWTHTDLYPFGGNAGNMYTAEASWVHYVPGVCASYTALAGSIGSGCYQYQVVAATTTTLSTTAPQATSGPFSALSTAASSSSTSSSSASLSPAASSSSASSSSRSTASSSSRSSASSSSSSSSSTSSSSSSAASSPASSPTSSPSLTTTPQSSTRSPSASSTSTSSISSATTPQSATRSPAASSTSTSSISSATTTTTGLSAAQPSNVNIARLPGVTATASSFRASSPPSGANDGTIGGLELNGSGNATQEWSTGSGTVPAWIQLTWPQSYLIKTVVLFPPVNLLNAIRAGTLTFSDGSTTNVGVLSPFGTQINLGAGKTTSSLRFTITGAAVARNGVGISEMRAYNAAPAVGGVLGGTTGVV